MGHQATRTCIESFVAFLDRHSAHGGINRTPPRNLIYIHILVHSCAYLHLHVYYYGYFYVYVYVHVYAYAYVYVDCFLCFYLKVYFY